MFIQLTKDKGLSFYNAGDEHFAVRSPTDNDDRYLHPERATRPVLLMMPHPFPSAHGRLYSNASVKNDTPYEVRWIRIEYVCGDFVFCRPDTNNFIASGGTWTVRTDRGICLITGIFANLVINGRSKRCRSYASGVGTGYSQFYFMWIDGDCCT